MNLNILKTSTPVIDEFENEGLSVLYRDEIEQCFKFNFKKILNQSGRIHFESILKETMLELGIENWKDEEVVFIKDWFKNITSFSHIRKYFEQDDITEIIFHGHDHIQIESNGKLLHVKIPHRTKSDYQLALEVLTSQNHISWNFSIPFASFHTSITRKTFRATLSHHSITPGLESKAFFRRIKEGIFPLSDFMVPDDLKLFFRECILNKKNIVISGATGSGKTSFMNTLMDIIPENEHLVVLEDSHEIHCKSKVVTYLLSDEKTEGKSLKDYCAYALRMRPDRIILGEMRSHEVVPFVLAMNTGHKGLISTIHANSAADTISRISILFSLYSGNRELKNETITELITKNIDYIIHLEGREIAEVIRLAGQEDGVPYFEYVYAKAGDPLEKGNHS
ncbi:MAG: Flp pilus assembly complex ATPase component TadA [Bacteriovoracaceae bacterium]|nr:Flp pilus assembly complex ATPase component TadA [Bacteriovoracaceae bacterium]